MFLYLCMYAMQRFVHISLLIIVTQAILAELEVLMLGPNPATIMMLHLLALVVVVVHANPKDGIGNRMTYDLEMKTKTIVTGANAMILVMTVTMLAMTFWCGFGCGVRSSERKFMGNTKVCVYPSGGAYHFEGCHSTPRTKRAKEVTITKAEKQGKMPCMCVSCEKKLWRACEKAFELEGVELARVLQVKPRRRSTVHVA